MSGPAGDPGHAGRVQSSGAAGRAESSEKTGRVQSLENAGRAEPLENAGRACRDQFPHLNSAGDARMVDVSDKQVTVRTASASATVLLSLDCVAALRDGTVPKGDALAVARIAGIQGAKRTSELVPLCHPLFLSGVDVLTEILDQGVSITATVKTTSQTGVEMEALTAVSVAALAIIDMIKAIDRAAVITDIKVLTKSGGRSGDWQRDD